MGLARAAVLELGVERLWLGVLQLSVMKRQKTKDQAIEHLQLDLRVLAMLHGKLRKTKARLVHQLGESLLYGLGQPKRLTPLSNGPPARQKVRRLQGGNGAIMILDELVDSGH